MRPSLRVADTGRLRLLGKTLCALAGAAALSAGLTACGGTSQADAASVVHKSRAAANPLGLVQPGVLTVANFGTEYPDVIIKGNRLTGIDGDLLTNFARAHHLKIKLFTTSFASTILAVEQHRADVAVNFYWNAARGKQVRFGVPYYEDTSVVIENKTKMHYTGPASLKGKKVGVLVGTIYTPIVQKEFPSSDISIYNGIPAAGQALINGQIDALIESISTYNAPPLAGSKVLKDFPIKPGQFGMTKAEINNTDSNIVGCKNVALANALNVNLRSLEKSGRWAKMVDKYKKYSASRHFIPAYKNIRGGCNG